LSRFATILRIARRCRVEVMRPKKVIRIKVCGELLACRLFCLTS